MRRYLIPHWLYRRVMNAIGKLFVYSFKREMDSGNLHEARHVAALLQVGNSGKCAQGLAPCLLDDTTISVKLPTVAAPIDSRGAKSDG